MSLIPLMRPQDMVPQVRTDFTGAVRGYLTGRQAAQNRELQAQRLQDLSEARSVRAEDRAIDRQINEALREAGPNPDLATVGNIYTRFGRAREALPFVTAAENKRRADAALELQRRADRRAQRKLDLATSNAQAQRQARVSYLVDQGYDPEQAENAVAAGFGGDIIKSTLESRKNKTKVASDLRKEFASRQDIKDYRKTSGFSDRIKSVYPDDASTEQGTGAKDIALIFSYMKILDPTSVVREGEQATAANAAGVSSSIAAQYNRLLGGGTLDTTARRQIIEAANQVMTQNRQRIQPTIDLFRSEAERVDVDPSRIFSADLVGSDLKTKYGLD